MITKREAELKAAFGRELERQLPGFLTLLYLTNGGPDREIVGNGTTTRWEFKHATPSFVSHGRQELLCMRLAAAAHCRYVIWWENAQGGGKRTMIVHPKAVHEKKLIPEAWCSGFDHRWLVDQVRRVHNA